MFKIIPIHRYYQHILYTLKYSYHNQYFYIHTFTLSEKMRLQIIKSYGRFKIHVFGSDIFHMD